jgi:hypothetical protein
VPGPRRCSGPEPYVEPVAIPPASIDALGGGGTRTQRIRRTLRALDATLDDVVLALSVGPRTGGGLRGGTYALRGHGVALRAYEYVPGVRVDASPRADGSARVRIRGTAAARGVLVLGRDGRISGSLAGARVRGSLGGGPPSV